MTDCVHFVAVRPGRSQCDLGSANAYIIESAVCKLCQMQWEGRAPESSLDLVPMVRFMVGDANVGMVDHDQDGGRRPRSISSTDQLKRELQNDDVYQRFHDSCAHRSEKATNQGKVCCWQKLTFICSHEEVGGLVKPSQCGQCPHYE